MAATEKILELTEKIFDESNEALDQTYAERVRKLGDSACKAGIEAAITYLSEKSELSEDELQMLSGGNIPEHYKLRNLEDHIEQLRSEEGMELDEREKSLCCDAFNSGLATAIKYLLQAAKLEDADLLSLIPPADQ